MSDYSETGLEVAVIGMAGRFPGAGNIDEFWDNLVAGKETIRFFTDRELEEAGISPQLLRHPNYVKARGYLDEIEYFDADFFDYPHGDAARMDPQMRLFLQSAWEALEHAGYNPGSYPGLIGLYGGSSFNLPWMKQLILRIEQGLEQPDAISLNYREYLCAQVAYKLDLRGPAITVNTACSTSLVALHLACQALLNGECGMALAGGITVGLPNVNGYIHLEGMILSPDGHCRSFDAGAAGTVFGSGVGIAVLKTLEDARKDRDTIYAVIKGSAVNNDGERKVGFVAPGVAGQTAVVKNAHYMAEVEPETLGYVEAHGTGTEMGDSIEIEALTNAFNTGKKNFCRIGSVKSNVGHLEAAAGITGFIKAVLALKHKTIPPTLHFKKSHPEIGLEGSPFRVCSRLEPWEQDGMPLRAAVNCYGIGGTNAYVILEEAPSPSPKTAAERPWKIFAFSALSSEALQRMTEQFGRYLERNPGLHPGDASFTLLVGRKPLPHRKIIVGSSLSDACMEGNGPPVYTGVASKGRRFPVFLLPGGPVPDGALEALYRDEPRFRREVDLCTAILTPMGIDILRRPSHPASGFVFRYALVRTLIHWGIKPAAVFPAGSGKLAADCLTGTVSMEAALNRAAAGGGDGGDAEPGDIKEWLAKEGTLFIVAGTLNGDPGAQAFRDMIVPGKRPLIELAPSQDKPPDTPESRPPSAHLLEQLGRLWLNGADVDWNIFFESEAPGRVPLPAYPFEKQHFPVDIPRPAQGGDAAGAVDAPLFTREREAGDYVLPKNDTEEKVTALFRRVLRIDGMGTDESFFDLGGDSLKAVILVSLIGRDLGRALPLADIFLYPTPAELAGHIDSCDGDGSAYSVIRPEEKKEYYPLSSAQKRLFTLQQMDKNLVGYNIPHVIAVEGEVDRERFLHAVNKLTARHESFRTAFVMVKGEPVQRIYPRVDFDISTYDLQVEEQHLKEAVNRKVREFMTPFELDKPPLIRVALVKAGDGKYFILLDLHHIITDGISQEVFAVDFLALYREEALPPLDIQYKEYAVWQHGPGYVEALEKQEEYWLKQFQQPPHVLDIPCDFSRPPMQSLEGRNHPFSFSAEESRAVMNLVKKEDVTLFMFFMAIVNVLCFKLSKGREPDVTVGVTVSGRRHADLAGIIGMFVNTLAIRNYPSNEKTFRQFLREVRETSLQAYENQDYQFERLVEKIGMRRDPSRHPLFQVGLAFQWRNRETEERNRVELSDIVMEPYTFENTVSKLDMTFHGGEAGELILFEIEYCTRLFKEETMKSFSRYFKHIVTVVLEDPEQTIEGIDIISSSESSEIISRIREKNEELDIDFDIDVDVDLS